ncbi:MAG TPA: hypothetical protein DD418_18685 [Pseudomonas sp.]|nr:hypothetical protein [Pseudomonas sp.]
MRPATGCSVSRRQVRPAIRAPPSPEVSRMPRPTTELPIYVINLPASTDRRSSMERQGAALGLRLQFFEAVNGRQPHPLFGHVAEKKRLLRKGRPFRPGEIGCWASHYLLWQRCLESGQPMIVLEDDVALDPALPALLADLRQLPDEVGYFRLHAADRPSEPWLCFGDHVLHRYWRSPLCTFGYYLAPAAAARFLRHADEWVVAVDDYMDLAWLHGVECLGLKRGLVSSDESFDSIIQAREGEKESVGPWRWLAREGYRLRLDVRRLLHDLPERFRTRAESCS